MWLSGIALDRQALPWRIDDHTVGYHLANSLDESQAAFRLIKAQLGNPDDTVYASILRPGIMLSNDGEADAEILTTSGVPVKALDGTRYVTISAHGFPRTPTNDHPEVWHPTKDARRKIGTFSRVVGDTDIALMTLEPGIRYDAELFEAQYADRPTPQGFRSILDVKYGELLLLDSPFSGRCDVQACTRSFRRHPSEGLPEGDHVPKTGNWLQTVWFYFADDIAETLNGTYGSTLNDESGRVVAFFDLTGVDNNVAEAIAAEYLMDEGLVLETISCALSKTTQAHPLL